MLKTFTLNVKQTATDLLGFLRNPSDTPVPDMQTPGKLKVLFGVLVLDVLLTFVFMGLINLVELLGWHKYDGHAVAELVRSFPLWGALLLGIIIVPFAEELVFRTGLRFRRGYFTFLLFVLLFAAGIFAFKMMPLLWALGAAFVLGVLMVIYLMNSYAIGEFLERAWPRVYATVFYSVAALFGLVHITNYTNFNYASLALLLIPVLIAPQIWAGLSIGYMRVKYGFFWGFFLHAAHNAVFLGSGLLFMSQLEEKLNISNENYSLKVEEHFRYDKTAGSKSMLAHDTAAFENVKLNDAITQLLQIEEVSIQNNTGSKLTRAVNLYYKSQAPDLNKTKADILSELQKLYKFDVTKAQVEKEMWDVEVENITALAANISDRGDKTSEIRVDRKGIEMQNVTVTELLAALQKEYNIVLADKTTAAGRYNFTFSKKSFQELKTELQEKYGLALQSKMIMTQQALVEFRK
jgi:hypothetical protein